MGYARCSWNGPANRTKVMEFVAGEHTPKNVMIAAIREREPFVDEALRTRIAELKKFFRIERHALDELLRGGSDPS